MMHPLLRLILTQPQLLSDHVEAYAELVGADIGVATSLWKKRAMLYALALCCLGVAVVLAGVALMLWAVIPVTEIQAPWALIATPLLPFVVALSCLKVASLLDNSRAFDNLRQQLKADMMMLREASGS